MSKEIPCPKCGHVWLWADWKRDEDAVCPNGHGCALSGKTKMTDNLVKRLRDTPNWMREGFQDWKDNVRTYDRAPFEAADRIEELEANALANRVAIMRLEAKLAKAVGSLERIELSTDTREQGAMAMATLAKLKGQDDE